MQQLHANDEKHFFQEKTFHVTYAFKNLHYEIEVHIPDLSDCDMKRWADWGPMCSCTLSGEQYVDITYHCVESGRAVRYTFHPPTIKVDSPSSIKQRQKTPRVVNITDTARGLVLSAYLAEDGRIVRTEATRLSPTLDISSLIFCDADHTPHCEELNDLELASAE